jgi:aminopeptidase N
MVDRMEKSRQATIRTEASLPLARVLSASGVWVFRSGQKVAVLATLAVIGAAAAVWLVVQREPPPPGPGIPLTVAETRASRITDLRYQATFRVPAARRDPVRGNLVATFMLSNARAPLAFDFAQPNERLLSVNANGRAIPARITDGHILIPPARLVRGANRIELEFLAGDEALNRQDEFLYTLFVPARASLAMPCFDQPNLKARWRVLLNVPLGWTAVANGKQVGRMASPDHLGFVFEETQPISTYLVAFAAGLFSEETAERDGRTFRMLHRETDAKKVARNRDAIFDLHARALQWLEDYTAIPYPFGKFDFVLIPSFQFGGMEHPGAVFYNASGLLLEESATENQFLGRAALISHETSHMWFGDLVTMAWFNDVWMKEVFANLMAAKIVNPSFPLLNHELRFLYQHYPSAYEVDRTDGANPIRQELANLDEAGSLYGAIIYQKAPIVMRQLERLLGADAFRDGLRAYLKRHAFGNATWPDLIQELDGRTPADLVAWSQAWVDEPGRPRITTEIDISGAHVDRLAFRQEDPRGRSLVWPQQLHVVADSPGGVKTFDIAVSGTRVEVPPAAGLPSSRWVLPVGGGLGYGDFVLDEMTLRYISTSLHEIPDPLTRGAALVALWESMLEGRVPSGTVMTALLTALPKETTQLTLSQLLEYVRAGFWRFTSADSRAALAAKLEAVLRAGLDQARTTSAKAAWFNALRSVATTPSTLAWLEKVWRRELEITGLPLAETDEAELALDLAVRDIPAAEEVLTQQLERFQNRDRKARFAFVTPALSREPAIREAFFTNLKDPANRRREAWVLEAARYLHHPLRATASRKLVKPALALVLEIQRTGDIFFPKRWADATLSGYQSVSTAAEVRAFIDALPPDYPPRLKWVLLASADPLFRAARISRQD